MMKFNIFIISLCLFFSTRVDVGAFGSTVTHPKMTEAAIQREMSTLDQFIQDNIGYADGINLPVWGVNQVKYTDTNTGNTVEKGDPTTLSVSSWIQEGAITEDTPRCRAANHFHNPLKSWGQSGSQTQSFWDDPYSWFQQWKCTPIYSAITWATGFTSKENELAGKEIQLDQRLTNPSLDPQVTNPDTDRSPNWSNAREKYYRAFTGLTENSRDAYLAGSLVSLGQVVHLLEDMGVPAHTRNDFESHTFLQNDTTLPFFDIDRWVYQPFERYVEKNTDTLIRDASGEVSQHPSDYTPSFPDPSLTKFWDTGQYYIEQNPSKATNIGLAEFSNANYLSDYTIPSNSPTVDHQFPNPKIDNSYHICEEPLALGIERRYVSRKEENVSGVCNDHYAAVPLMSSFLRSTSTLNSNISTLHLILDDKVHETYAKELLPRTIGYASKLVDYFFRGKLTIEPQQEGIYGVIDGSQLQAFSTIKARITNNSDGNETMQDGTIVLVAEYKKIKNYNSDLSSYPLTADEVEALDYSYSVSEPIKLPEPLTAKASHEFTFNFQEPIPVGITELYLTAVFKGTLGNEKNIAVAVGYVPLYEPVHQTFWNLTDRFSLNDVLRTEEEINSNPDYKAQVDSNKDYVKPYNMNFEISYGTKASPSVAIDDVVPGGYIHLITLVDKDYNSLKFKVTDTLETGESETTEYASTFNGARCGEYVDGFYCDAKELFRNVRQDFYRGMVRCDPYSKDASGQTYCFYDPGTTGTTMTNVGPLNVNIAF